MVGSLALAFFAWLFTRKGRLPKGKWATIFSWGCLAAIPFPFLANSSGWIFTEMGRQPWVIHPNPESVGDPRTESIRMLVDHGVSGHEPWVVIVTLVGFTLIYGILAMVWFWLIRRVVLDGPPAESGPEAVASETTEDDEEKQMQPAGTVSFARGAEGKES